MAQRVNFIEATGIHDCAATPMSPRMSNMPMCRNAHARGVPVIRCRSRWPRVQASTAQGRPWRRHASGRPVGVGPNPKGSGLGPRPRMGRSPVPGVGTNPAQSQAQSVPAKARAQLLACSLPRLAASMHRVTTRCETRGHRCASPLSVWPLPPFWDI